MDELYNSFEHKVIELAAELAGYQIDKMPEKFEKKINTFIGNINCFEDNISIELNDKDIDALSKIESLDIKSNKIKFISNSEISRGDIILNCDGMHYSEKTNIPKLKKRK